MLKNYTLLLLLFVYANCFTQTGQDSIAVDCADFEAKIEQAFTNKRFSYKEYETLVLNTLSNGNESTFQLASLAQELANSSQINYDTNADSFDKINKSIFRLSFSDEFTPIFKNNDYKSKFQTAKFIWELSWEYLKHHTIDVKTFASLILKFSNREFLDLSLTCNQKVFVTLLGKIIGDQKKNYDRIDFYEKSESIIDQFFQSANLDINDFENDFQLYLNSFGFIDSTIENQYFAYHFYTSDLKMIPFPKTNPLQNKFRKYNTQLFSQQAFTVDTTKIIARPTSRDSISLIKDIIRAYPDSIMFAPGKTALELKLEQLVYQENKDDRWFLSIYAGIFDQKSHDIREAVLAYTPNDFRSRAFRKWYALFILREMFNTEKIENGIKVVANEFKLYPDFGEKINNYLSLFLFNASSVNELITKPYYDGKRIQNFNTNNYYFEVFNNPLFKEYLGGFRIQLKINPSGEITTDATVIEPAMSATQEKLLRDALSKYKFDPFLIQRPDSTGYGWIQITCKQQPLSSSIDEEAFYMDDIEMVVEMPPPPPPVEPEEEIIYSFTETQPLFPGGEKEMYKFIKKQMPKNIVSKDKGKVYIKVVVNKDGSLTNLTVLKGINKELDNIAKEIVAAMPNWTPAEYKGESVRSRMTIPIVFD